MKFKTKLILTSLLPIGLFVLLFGYFFFEIDQVIHIPLKMYKHPFTVSNAVRDIKINLYEANKNIANSIIQNKPFSAISEDVKMSVRIIENSFALVDERFLGEKSKVKKSHLLYKKWCRNIRELLNIKKPLTTAEAQSKIKKLFNLESKAVSEINFLLSFARDKGLELNKKAMDIRKKILYSFFISVLIISIFSILFSIVYTSKMKNKFEVLVRKLGKEFSTLKKISSRLYNREQKLIKLLTDESESLQKSSSSLDKINIMVSSSVGAVNKASDLSNQNLSHVQQGEVETTGLIKSVENIEYHFLKLQEKLSRYEEDLQSIATKMDEVESKTKEINNIVFQTQLLSFNASIEATRAGQHGKGFSVVAEEIGTLASSSGSTAREINTIINESSDWIQEIIENFSKDFSSTLNNSSNIVLEGKQAANACQSSFNSILNDTKDMDFLIEEVRNTCNEQRLGVNKIAHSISNINSMAADNKLSAKSNLDECKDLNLSSGEIQKVILEISEYINLKDSQEYPGKKVSFESRTKKAS